MKLVGIVAMTNEGLMGRDGDLPWHLPEDLLHFQRTTKGHAVLMGRKSWDAMPGPLPKRLNVVVSRSLAGELPPQGETRDGARWFGSLDDAWAWLADGGTDGYASDVVFLLGGAEIFRAALAPLEGERDPSVSVPSEPRDRRARDRATSRAAGNDAAPAPARDDAVRLPVPERLIVTWVPSMPARAGDVVFPYSRAWIEARYDVVESWRSEGETPLEFVVYARS